MAAKYRKWHAAILIIFLMAMPSCASKADAPQENPSSPAAPTMNAAGVQNTEMVAAVTMVAQTQAAIPSATPTAGPFVVEQTMVLGGETIEGEVCNSTEEFDVNATTPAVSFIIKFVPETAEHGSWTYDYSIPSGPETHDASGTYTIGRADADGKLLLSMDGTDAVVGHLFAIDQSIDYEFKLVPSSDVAC